MVLQDNPIKEEWRDIQKRLAERFPSVPSDRISEILNTHDGHAGDAARALRNLVSTDVSEADPDDVEHVSTLLSSPAMFKHACKEKFRRFDINGDGSLEWNEIRQLVSALYEEFGLQPPAEGTLRAFFIANDENKDGVLSAKEFRKFFEMFLRYSFFDIVKLRQVVEEGKAIEDQNGTSISDSQNSSVASISNSAKYCIPEDQSISARRPSPSKLSQCTSLPSLTPTHQSRFHFSPKASPVNASSMYRWKQHNGYQSPQKAKGRHHELSSCVSLPSLERKMRCVAPQGVAYRATPAFHDRSQDAVNNGEAVQVLEHWIRTPQGWLPVADPHGRSLFEQDIEDRQHKFVNSTIDKRKKVTLREHDNVTSPQMRKGNKSTHIVDEEWKPLFDRLCGRFPHISTDKIAQALYDNDGHGGKVASVLRCM